MLCIADMLVVKIINSIYIITTPNDIPHIHNSNVIYVDININLIIDIKTNNLNDDKNIDNKDFNSERDYLRRE